jgi:glycosyltransferase involved in cell wall biosynthesis
MKILFGVLNPSFGGHTRTAVALAGALRRRGHEVDLAVDRQVTSDEVIRAAEFRVLAMDTRPMRPFRLGFTGVLRAIARDGRYDAIHWFEVAGGVWHAARAAAAEGRAFVWTVTSGNPPPAYYGLNRAVVFTSEVADDLRRRSPRTTAHVVPARIDPATLDPDFVRNVRAEVRSRLGIPAARLLVVRVARCNRLYIPGVRLGIRLAERLNAAGRDAAFLHAGYPQEPEAAAAIAGLVADANLRARRVVAWSETRDVALGTRFAAAADVCIASGRSAIEAIALERPTFVVWEHRYLGLVDDHSIADLADTNFQGRLSPRMGDDEQVVAAMAQAIATRLNDPERAERIARACAAFVESRYSIDEAAAVYERLYADRTIALDGPLRHFAGPGQFIHELRGWRWRTWTELTRMLG